MYIVGRKTIFTENVEKTEQNVLEKENRNAESYEYLVYRRRCMNNIGAYNTKAKKNYETR